MMVEVIQWVSFGISIMAFMLSLYTFYYVVKRIKNGSRYFECIILGSNIFVLIGLLVMFHTIFEGIVWEGALNEQRIGD